MYRIVNISLVDDWEVGVIFQYLFKIKPTSSVQCRKLYSFVVYLYVNGSGSITSVGEERANLSAVVYL